MLLMPIGDAFLGLLHIHRLSPAYLLLAAVTHSPRSGPCCVFFPYTPHFPGKQTYFIFHPTPKKKIMSFLFRLEMRSQLIGLWMEVVERSECVWRRRRRRKRKEEEKQPKRANAVCM